jgi:hypothetical protein
MTRDRRSFFIDALLPIVLIIIGLYMTTVDLIGNAHYPVRNMSAYDFPGKQPLIYNRHNFNQTDDEVQDFIDRTMAADIGTMWSHLNPVDTDVEA